MIDGEIVGGVIDLDEFFDVPDILLLLVGVPDPPTFEGPGLDVRIVVLEEDLVCILNDEGCLVVEICGLLVYLWLADSFEVVFLCFVIFVKDDKSKDGTSFYESITIGSTTYSMILGNGRPK